MERASLLQREEREPFAPSATIPITPSHVRLRGRVPANAQRRLQRTLVRVLVLLAGDAVVYLILRTAVNGLRRTSVAPGTWSDVMRQLLPRGFLGGWEFAIAVCVGLIVSGAYGSNDAWRESGRILRAVLLGVGLVLWSKMFESPSWIILAQALVASAAVFVALLLERGFIGLVVARFPEEPRYRERALIVGKQEEAGSRRIRRLLCGQHGMICVGWLDPNGVGRRNGYLGTTADIRLALSDWDVDTVVLTGRLPDEGFEKVVDAARMSGCRLISASRYDRLGFVRPRMVWIKDVPFTELRFKGLKTRELAIKRAMDMVGAALGLFLLSPILALITFAIKLDSPGPVVFSQRRVGLGGRPFHIHKFRTMRVGADAEKMSLVDMNHTGDTRLFKIPDDPRVTRVGKFLRKWSLDELPQFWDVLKGDMSLVGPRPFFEEDLEGYEDHHFERLGAKPGITGLWQVRGRSSVTDFDHVVQLDREYINHWSVWLDIRILADTIPAVFRRTGAY